MDEDRVYWLTLNRPEKINAMNRRLIAELKHGLLRADNYDAVNVIVIRGNGNGFCAGHDLYEDAQDVHAWWSAAPLSIAPSAASWKWGWRRRSAKSHAQARNAS
ncbi:enoyl-CoA hydratase/isomerase family protein [Mesorhizobium sp. 131-3-5]|uniref:enoyl-CoA hydratase/isomerase family protein n=1 Tax=Mesorhizobium sp. 131-3-5 TaxID=2744520 RepID=UPI00406D021B